MKNLKKLLHNNSKKDDNFLLLYHLGLFETLVFVYDYHSLFFMKGIFFKN